MNQPFEVRLAKSWMERAWTQYLEFCDTGPTIEEVDADPDKYVEWHAWLEEYCKCYLTLASLYEWRYLVANLPDDCTCTPRDVEQCAAHPVADPSAALPY